jgi:hypothetical protein
VCTTQPLLLVGIVDSLLHRLASNHNLPDFCLPSSWDYRHETGYLICMHFLMLAFFLFFCVTNRKICYKIFIHRSYQASNKYEDIFISISKIDTKQVWYLGSHKYLMNCVIFLTFLFLTPSIFSLFPPSFCTSFSNTFSKQLTSLWYNPHSQR